MLFSNSSTPGTNEKHGLPLCKLVKRGAVRANDLPLSNDLEAWPDSSVGRAPTYKVRGREFESRSGRLFSRTFTFQAWSYSNTHDTHEKHALL